MGWLSRRLVVVSESARRLYGRGSRGSKIDLVRQAVEMPEVEVSTASVRGSERESCPLRIVYVSNIYEAKRQVDAVHAARILRDAGVPLTLTLVGNADPVYHAA